MRQLTADGYFDELEDLALVERYQAAQRKLNFHIRDLYTFLNKYRILLDRARDWEEINTRPKRKREAPRIEQRTDATGANIMVESDPAAIAEPRPISESVNKFLIEFEQRKGRKLKGHT